MKKTLSEDIISHEKMVKDLNKQVYYYLTTAQSLLDDIEVLQRSLYDLRCEYTPLYKEASNYA